MKYGEQYIGDLQKGYTIIHLETYGKKTNFYSNKVYTVFSLFICTNYLSGSS